MSERPTLRVGFVAGVEPDRFMRRWKTARRDAWLELILVPWSQQDAVLERGEVDMVFQRLVSSEDPTWMAADGSPLRPEAGVPDEELHRVRLWEERAVIVVGDENLLSLHEEVGPEDLVEETEITVEHLDDASDRVAVVATGIGYTRMPMSLARLHHRKDAVLKVLRGAEPTQIALTWRRCDDSPVIQEFVGTVRGRTARSSR